jgi:prepilin-type N-terminal cleavage/methylation domain-containing protein
MSGNAKGTRGFTIIELLVAVVVLSLGTLLIAGGSLFITRDLVRTRMGTAALGQAASKAEELRATAASTSPGCTAAAFTSSSSATTTAGVTLSWVVPNSGAQRTILVITSYGYGRGKTHTDTLSSYVQCS